MQYRLVNYCEFDESASKAYSILHNINEDLNLGDITKVDETKLNDFDLMVGGSPCQDFSIAGMQKGVIWTCNNCKNEYNPLEAHHSSRNKCPKCHSTSIEKTRSSLLIEWLRVLKHKKPKFAIYENVKNIIGKKHKRSFNLFVEELHEYGYNTYYKVLNAKDFLIPQNRERLFLIAIRKDVDNGLFQFPQEFSNDLLDLGSFIREDAEEKEYLNQDQLLRMFNTNFKRETYKEYTVNTVSQLLNGSCDIKLAIHDYRYDEGLRLRKNNICPCLTTRAIGQSLSGRPLLIQNGRLRSLSVFELFRLMGFTDEDVVKLQKQGISEAQLGKQVGNSIVVTVLHHILTELHNAMPYLFDNLKVGSFFSGIGAFERALELLYNNVVKGELLASQSNEAKKD